MSREPFPAQARQVLRYGYGLVLVLGLSAVVLAGAVVHRYRTEIAERTRIEQLHLRGMTLSQEGAEASRRLRHSLAEPGPAGRRASAAAAASLAQTLEALEELHASHPRPAFEGPVERLRPRLAHVQAALAGGPDGGRPVAGRVEALALALRQLHQLHSVELEYELEEMAQESRRRAIQLAVFMALVLGVSGLLVYRLLRLIRVRLEEQLRTEQELRERDRQLQHGQKLQALGTLVGGVAHDFNNLLTVITGYTQVLRSRLPEGSRERADAEQIAAAGERASQLTRQLLAFSRYEIAERGHVAVDAGIEEFEPRLRQLLREDIRLELALAAAGGRVHLDPAQLEQLLMNLCTNASHAMPRGGRLSISTTDRRREDLGRCVHLRVADEGVGMEADVAARAFDPFFTTRPPDEGTGLGLSTVHGIVTRIGGRVELDSTPGEGTTVELYLPWHEPAAGPEANGDEPADVPAGSGTVLLVEDDEQVRALAARALGGAGYHVVSCRDGDEALARFEAHGAPFDLVLSDVVMPGRHGPEVVEELRQRQPGLPAVFMSGYTDEAVLAQVRQSADPLVAKPFRLEELLRVVGERLGRARA